MGFLYLELWASHISFRKKSWVKPLWFNQGIILLFNNCFNNLSGYFATYKATPNHTWGYNGLSTWAQACITFAWLNFKVNLNLTIKRPTPWYDTNRKHEIPRFKSCVLQIFCFQKRTVNILHHLKCVFLLGQESIMLSKFWVKLLKNMGLW